jgi:16S rRNA (cytidine1402-2'-O)-methyltransferase
MVPPNDPAEPPDAVRSPGGARAPTEIVEGDHMDPEAARQRGGAGVERLEPGLWLVATPIGNARDVTLRALDVLARADAIAAEDTRRAKQLLDIHGVALGGRPILRYDDHAGARTRPAILARLAAGEAVALVSDAGTPMVADPGYRLAREAAAAGVPVRAAPGASAVLAALSVAGLPSDRFLFAGFPPAKAGERARWLADLAAVPATLVLYESPRRLADSLAAMAGAFGDREAAVCRELTKKFEETRRGSLAALAEAYADEPDPKGEIVVVIGPPAAQAADAETIDAALRRALETQSVRDAARTVAEALGAPRKAVYSRALEIAGEAR